MKTLLTKILGSYLNKKAGLYEGTPTHGKSWFKSKTILSGIAVLLRATYEGASLILEQANGTKLPPIPPIIDTLLLTILGAGAIHGRVDANVPIVVDDSKPLK